MPAERISHSSELGRWEMVAGEPAPLLRRDVFRYFGYDETTSAFTRRRELATPHAVLIIGFGPAIGVTFAGERRGVQAVAFAAGPSDRHVFVDSCGTQRGVQIDMTPTSAYALLGVPMRELANRVVELGDLLGPRWAELPERLHEAGSWEERFGVLDELLLARLGDGTQVSPDVARAWRRLHETYGAIGIRELADELRCSRRHLSQRFAEQVGLPPKTVARLLRFERAARMVGAGPSFVERTSGAADGGLARIALDCGYYDQAHLNRDFRQFAGVAPKQLEAMLLPDGGGIAEPCSWPELMPEIPSVQVPEPAAA